MKPVDVKSNTHINCNKEINNKDPEFKIGDIVNKRLHSPNWSEEVFMIKKVKNTVPWTWTWILMHKKLLELFIKNNCKNKSERV